MRPTLGPVWTHPGVNQLPAPSAVMPQAETSIRSDGDHAPARGTWPTTQSDQLAPRCGKLRRTSKRDTTSSMDSDWTAVAIKMLRRAEPTSDRRMSVKNDSHDQYILRLDSLRVASSPAQSSVASLTPSARTMKIRGKARTFEGSTALLVS